MTNRLPPGSRDLLHELADAADREDWDAAEIVCDGLECWIGDRQTSWRSIRPLLRRCLIRSTAENLGDKIQRFEINEHGRKAIDDPTYIPPEVVGLVPKPAAPNRSAAPGVISPSVPGRCRRIIRPAQ